MTTAIPKCMHRLNLLFNVMLLCALFSLFPAAASSGTPDAAIVRIEGLSLRCPGCRMREDGYCEVDAGESIKDGEPVPCEKLLDVLLPRTLEAAYDGLHPSADELLRFALSKHGDAKRTLYVLTLLSRSEAGRKELRTHIRDLLSLYSSVIDGAAAAGTLDREFASSILNMLRHQTGESDRRMFITLAAVTGLENLEETLASITSGDVPRDVQRLSLLREAGAKTNSTHVREIDAFLLAIESCRRISAGSSAAEIAESCAAHAPGSPIIQAYLERLELSRLLNILREKEGRPEVVIGALARLPEAHRYDATSRELVLAALHHVPDASPAWSVSAETKEELDTFAEKDPAVAAELQRITADNSLAASPEGTFSVTNRESSKRRVRWPWMAVAIFPLSYACWRCKKPRALAVLECRSDLNPDERSELRMLRTYFNLSPKSSKKDLVRTYHLRARELHPDRAPGSSAEFSSLAEKYKRAGELLDRLTVVDRN